MNVIHTVCIDNVISNCKVSEIGHWACSDCIIPQLCPRPLFPNFNDASNIKLRNGYSSVAYLRYIFF
jgi:hypothetical protein